MSIIKINTTLIFMVILLDHCVTQRRKASSTISATTGTDQIVTTTFPTFIHQHSHQKMVTLTKPKKGQQVKQNVIQSVFSEKEFDQFHDYHQISRVTGIPVSTIMKIAAKVGFRDKKFKEIVELLTTEHIL